MKMNLRANTFSYEFSQTRFETQAYYEMDQ